LQGLKERIQRERRRFDDREVEVVDWLNLRIEGLGKMLILSFSCGVVLVRSVTDVILDCFVGWIPGLFP
jgi:hypothetical protein